MFTRRTSHRAFARSPLAALAMMGALILPPGGKVSLTLSGAKSGRAVAR